MSQISAAMRGSDRILELVDRYGYRQVSSCIEQILDSSESRMRRQISQLKKGTYYFKDYLDSDGHSNAPVPICVKVVVKGRSVEVDFTGSAPQRPGPTNASLAVTSTAVFVAMKALLDPEGHINAGAFRPFDVKVPAGSLLNASHPAPMGGFVEVLRRVESALMGAMSRCVPDRVAGDTKGCANHVYISHLSGNAVRSIHYEYPSGGTGAFDGGDGSNAVREWDTGDFSAIHSAEIVELEHPCLIEECSLRVDSGGAGKWRGGLGLRRVIRVLGEQGRFSVLSDRNVIPPFGVNGGRAGQPNEFKVFRDGKFIAPSPLPGKVSGFLLRKNDRVISLSSGGGGFGDPCERDVEAVLRDLACGYVSEAAARNVYGVFGGDRGKAAILKEDGQGPQMGRPSAAHCKIRRTNAGPELERVEMSSETAELLGLEDRSMIELSERVGAPPRGIVWISDEGLPNGLISISTDMANILQCKEGAPLSIRLLSTTEALDQSIALANTPGASALWEVD
jgi:N-methylhydantoinase B